ncbi:MAG: 5'-nucleotidase C-terminal domain-containing protein [Candidatus Aminicenantales bacterium]
MNQRVLRFFWVAGLVLGLAVFACANTKKLTILHTNDTHSAMVPFETGFIPAVGPAPRQTPGIGAGLWNVWHFPFNQDYAGIARMATLIKTLRVKDKNVLALNAGDVFVGSFEFNKYLGYPELKIMENLYDAMELGNHEFDLGVGTLAGVLNGQIAGAAPVTLPLLCANVDFSATPLGGMVQSSIVRTVGGVKVGIFGLLTQEPQNYSENVNKLFPYPYDGSGTTLWEYATGLVTDLRKQGCKVVICVSHLGTMLDVGALSKVPGIDVIIGGHSHDAYPQPIVANGKIIVQAGQFGWYLGELKLNVGSNGVTLDSWVLHRVDGRIKEDPQVRGIVNKVKAGVVSDPRFGPVYSQHVALALRDILKSWPANSQNRDTALGNLVTDAFISRLKKAGLPFPVDCALDVLGYLGADIPAGKVVGNNIMRAVPYGYNEASGLGFKVVVVPLPPEGLLGGLEYAADNVTLTTDLAVQGSGITYSYDSSKTPGNRVDPTSVMVNGELVAAQIGVKDKYYYVAMSEQVFNFLNALTGGQLSSLPTGLFEYNIVRDYMKSLRFVQYKSEGRIKDTNPAPAAVK